MIGRSLVVPILNTLDRVATKLVDDVVGHLFAPSGGREQPTAIVLAKQLLLPLLAVVQFLAPRLFAEIDGMTLPAKFAVTWEDQGKPWSYWDLDAYYWNVDVSGILN